MVGDKNSPPFLNYRRHGERHSKKERKKERRGKETKRETGKNVLYPLFKEGLS